MDKRSEVVQQDIENHICPICICLLVKPVKLPCSHWLCILCSDELVDSEVGDTAKCPLCRKDLEPNFPNRVVNKEYDDTLKIDFPEEYTERLVAVQKAQRENKKERKIVFVYGNRYSHHPERDQPHS